MLIQWLRNEMFRPCYEAEEGTPTGGNPSAVSLPAAPEAETADDYDKERAFKTIQEQRRIEKELRAQVKELDALKAAEKERKAAEMSEADRLKAELKEERAARVAAAAQLKRATLKDAVSEAATKASLTFAQGALSDALSLGLFDSLEWDGDKPKGVGQVLKDLAQARPYLFNTPADTPDIRGGNGKATKETDLSSLAQRWGIRVGN